MSLLHRAIYNAQRRNAYLTERRIHEGEVLETDAEESEDQESEVEKTKDKAD